MKWNDDESADVHHFTINDIDLVLLYNFDNIQKIRTL